MPTLEPRWADCAPCSPTEPWGGRHVCSPWCGCRRKGQHHKLLAVSDEPTVESQGEEKVKDEEGPQDAEAKQKPEDKPKKKSKKLTPEEQERQKHKDELKDLEAKLAKKRNELTEAQDRLRGVGKEGYMRLAAQIETYKRQRADGLAYVREEAVKEAVEPFIPVLDLLEELEAKYGETKDEKLLKFIQGYRGLAKTFLGKVERLGLASLTAGVGDAYDLSTMDVEWVPGDKDDVILEIVKKGFTLGGRTVRPLRVKVSITEQTKKERESRDVWPESEKRQQEVWQEKENKVEKHE